MVLAFSLKESPEIIEKGMDLQVDPTKSLESWNFMCIDYAIMNQRWIPLRIFAFEIDPASGLDTAGTYRPVFAKRKRY